MIKAGITGQVGFMGTHLFNYLNLKDDVEAVPFEDAFFDEDAVLDNFVAKCDVVVHLAAMNRHEDQQVIYDTNILLVEKLIAACERTQSKPHILFSSSTQEKKDNLYGQSKQKGRELFEVWANRNNARFTGMIIPNVFGPFGQPHYNSVVATFCHQLTHGETPQIHVDGEVKLIYINDLSEEFYNKMITRENRQINKYEVPHRFTVKVSTILNLLKSYKNDYLEKGIFPDLSNPFELALFNTFRCYIPENHFPFYYTKHADNRGIFVEIARTNTSGQFSYSTTVPGITRGNHYHTRKAERFAVIKGKAKIQLRRIGTNQLIEYDLSGEQPSFVDMPIWYTHNIINTGNEELVTLFWINEPFNPDDPDTYFETV
jgi:UDP-2-acetamido-2,6-beta-L-arabino-hexul-4-ose reductase